MLSAAVFTYFCIETITIVSSVELQVIVQLYSNATMLKLLAMEAGLIAFTTGIYATLAHSVGLAFTVCVMNGISYYLVSFMILLT